jgi:hypothetical protein
MAKQRTSFALDGETIRVLQELAERWRVSQAEVVRRAVRAAAEADRSDSVGLTDRLARYRDAGRMTAEAAEAYLGQLAGDRAGWERGMGS